VFGDERLEDRRFRDTAARDVDRFKPTRHHVMIACTP
jgi:hypothetical protein